MKTFCRHFVILFVVLLVPAITQAEPADYMRISHLEGDVQIKIPEGEDWGPAVVNGPLAEGDQVWVPKGARAEIQLASGAFVRLDSGSALQVLAHSGGASQFHLSQGGLYVYAEKAERDALQIDTPDASIRSNNSVVYRVDLTDTATDVAVYKGSVETENSLGQTRVPSEKMLSLGRGNTGTLAPLGAPDAWERWNTARNDLYRSRTGTSTLYLPEELKGYANDFDTGGRWVEVPEYGSVWTPTVIIVEQWAPYRHGRWLWRHGHYIWLPYDPWGWVPYHYGRWTYVKRHGWCWVPPRHRHVHWAPGYVGWVRRGSHIGWVPLAPGEIYYGRGHYGEHSVNITNVNIRSIHVTNIYRNVTVNNGATVAHSDHFHSNALKPVAYNHNEHRELFGSKSISIGGPAIKPGRNVHQWSEKKISADNRPPREMNRVSVGELKQQRPQVRETGRSVFHRGEPTRNMPVTNVGTPSMPRRGKDPIRREDSQPATKPGFRDPGGDQRQLERAPAGKPGFRDPSTDQRRPSQQPPATKPGFRDNGADHRRMDTPPAGKPGFRDGGNEQRRSEPAPAGKPGFRESGSEPRRTPDPSPAGRPGSRDSGVEQRRPAEQQPASKPGASEQRGLQPTDRARDTRPGEQPATGGDRRQERGSQPSMQQERDRTPGGPGIQPERGRPGGRDGSYDNNRNRQQVNAAARTEASRNVHFTERKIEKPQPRQEQPRARTQSTAKAEQKNDTRQVKEQRKENRDGKENRGAKENRKHEERG